MSDSITFTLTGMDKLESALTMLGSRAAEWVGAALYLEAEAVMTTSKQHFVPVDKGTLRASGYVKPPFTEGANVKVELGFGGAASAYALFVHENLKAHHPVGQAKYLETPLLQSINGMSERLAAKLRPQFESAAGGA